MILKEHDRFYQVFIMKGKFTKCVNDATVISSFWSAVFYNEREVLQEVFPSFNGERLFVEQLE